ncbi:MAG: efflux RND transporter periplasmic adaptor subunit [Planctomycetota bacterium]|nr:MAG: efflux RND transporter periplasmic adaptor subunit [Planctomycetota bacterium]
MKFARLANGLGILLLLGSLWTAACSVEGRAASGQESETANASADSPEAPQEATLVRVQNVLVAPMELKLEATANIESLDSVDVVAERAEPVLEILVEEGDRVRPGQVLARLRSSLASLSLQEAVVRVSEASDELARVQRDHDRNLKLAKEGQTSLISEREVETSAQALLAAKTRVESAKLSRDLAAVDLERCTLTAPIAGTVTARDISLGDMTTMGARVFQIVDLHHPKAIFYRPQRELSLLQVGQKLSATSEAFPGVLLHGEIERISPIVDTQSGTIKVTAAIDPSAAEPPLDLLPVGILVRLELVLDRHEEALLIPKRALLYEGQKVLCYVARDGVAKRIEVIPGFEDPEYLECLPAAGLLATDQVVVVGADRLADGDLLEILQDQPEDEEPAPGETDTAAATTSATTD